ncbi:hypothetical protein VTJ83DRAFT_512 [Remersonia thermophila]|uniref:Extracellular serine-rich protein n=1 Tax=Remersonia thermophila TaxID=72144 RepID=A0ABR4DL66_9PEZI
MLTTQILRLLFVLAGSATAQVDIHTSTQLPTPMADNAPSSPSTTATSSSSKGPATVTIAVGANGHFFTPTEATANVGDIIKFNFYPGGHRVARAAFGWPCIPYEYANINKPGFYTGIFTPQVVSNDPPSYSVRVNDTEPIFFYCAAPGSCIDYHMIGVINPNATHTLAKQLEYARNTTYQLAPGEPFPSESAHPRPSPTAGTAPDAAGSSGSEQGSSSSGDNGGSSLSAGAIAGIAIGGAAVLVLAGALLYICGRRGGFDKAYRKSVVLAGGGGGLGSPAMVEARYPNTSAGSPGLGVGLGAQAPKDFAAGAMSPTTTAGLYGPALPHSPSLSMSQTAGSAAAPAAYGPGSGTLPAYHPYAGPDYASPQASPRTDQYAATPAPVELPTHEPIQSPPGYHSIGDARGDVESQRGKP